MSIDLSKYQNTSAVLREKPNGQTDMRSGKGGIMDFLNKDIALFGKELSDKQKERFYSELYTLFDSGVDIKTALELLQHGKRKKKELELYAQISKSVMGGSGLSEALENTSKFSAYEYKSIGIGEESGQLQAVLEELQAFFLRKMKLKKQFISAIAYPGFVFMVAIGVIWFMLVLVVPMFSDVYSRFGGELPWLTQSIVGLSETFGAQFKYWLVGLLILIIFFYTQRKKVWFRKYSAAFAIRIPIVGKVIQLVFLGRFCQSMSLLIASKTPLVQTIGLIREMISWYPMEAALEKVQDDLQRGIPLNQSMGQFPEKTFPAQLVALVKVAEEVNQLDRMFDKLAQQYSNEVEHKTGLIGSLLEPIMIIFIGLIVGIILVAMYLPMFDLSNKIG